jgi:N-acetylmuramoyl-L-alanine amidase
MPILNRILPRALWDALAARYAYNLPVYPVTHVFIHHGATHAPLDLRDADGDGAPDNEESTWRGYQRYHMNSRGWSDIAYSFGVGLSGQVYEGRGWRRQGGATGSPEDRHSLSICAIGNYENQQPSDAMLNAIVAWIVTGIELGHISPDVIILGHKDKPYGTSCPGKNLYQHLPRIRSEVRDGRVSEEEFMEGPIEEWYRAIADAPDGTRNEGIRVWQLALAQWGYLPFADIDGVKGPQTRAAHRAFEADSYPNGTPNGKPGAKSWPKLIDPPQQIVTETVEIPVIPPTVRDLVAELWGEVNDD